MKLALLILFGTLLTEAWGQGIYHLSTCAVVAFCYLPRRALPRFFGPSHAFLHQRHKNALKELAIDEIWWRSIECVYVKLYDPGTK